MDLRPREDVRERIIEASMRVFSVHGFFKAPLSLVARKAGVSKGLIFWYFRSKDELILEVASRSLPLDAVKSCLQEDLEKEELLRCIGMRYLEKYRNPVMRNLMLHSISAETLYPQIGEKIRDLCGRLLRDAAEKVFGRADEKSVVAMRTFFGSLQCYSLRPPRDISPERYLQELISLVLP